MLFSEYKFKNCMDEILFCYAEFEMIHVNLDFECNYDKFKKKSNFIQ